MVELKALTVTDGMKVFEMVRTMGNEANGFRNSLYADDFATFQNLLVKYADMAKGLGLGSDMVPQTVYWLMADDRPVGYGKLRHRLNNHLRNHGGHIGFAIAPEERQKGYATLMLGQLLEQAGQKGIHEALITCDETNTASRKVIEANNGHLQEINNGSCFYWVNLRDKSHI